MSSSTNVEIINFGDELLVGIRANEHLEYLGAELARYGLPVRRASVICDANEEIRASFNNAMARSDLIITTGGLGPTSDDLTRETIAEVLGEELVHDSTVEAAIRNYFQAIDRPMAEHHRKQCYVFKGGEVLQNKKGTAPGLYFRSQGKTVVLLPGPTQELRPMFIEEVIPRLRRDDYLRASVAFIQLRTCGCGESSIESRIKPIVDAEPDLQVAYCAHYGIVDIRLSSRTGLLDYDDLERISQAVARECGDDFFGYGGGSLAEVVHKRLRDTNGTLAVAESCTGGMLSDAFTNISGASKTFIGGIVCYSNEVKVSQVNVPESILMQHGAVSSECAIAMATGVAEGLSAHHGLSVTGFAGPEGGNKNNPVGTIHIGYHSPAGVWSKTVRYTGGRLDVKARAVHAALDWMRRELMQSSASK
ncbi:MAG: Nicotinamide-nucleotide amidohydrolase PncC [Opitutia bacterium UBA7350]|nr:MAG: Nicotinamide-nucleotide amidohydrolase PncC [Opitutae bacterium UBA7350]